MDLEYPLIISSAANIFYYSGLNCDEALLLIYNDKKIIITDSRYEEAARNTGLDVAIISAGTDLADAALDLLCDYDGEILVYEDYDMIAKDFLKFAEKYKMMPVSDEFLKVRSIKTKDEIEKMLTASKIASKAVDKAFSEAKEGMTEAQMTALIDFTIRAAGAQGNSFDTIVAFGKNASMPHHEPDNTPLKKGDCVLIDLGAKFEGYCSDMTRMFYFGDISEKDREIYDITLKAQEAGLNAIKAGAKCSDVDKAARDVINGAGYGDCFGHGTGHGVGVEIHEYPRLNQTSESVLETGMVVTVEPGIYLPGDTGVRIEDMVVVTDDGYINLSTSDKNLKIK